MKKVLSVLMVLVILAGLFTACGKPASTEESNQFRVGMECAYAPFNWTQTDDANGAVPIDGGSYAGGYDVELAKKVAAGLGKELVIVKIEWDGLLPALTSGKIDAIMAGMSPTEERKQTIDFSANYYTSDLVLVVKKDGPYANAKAPEDFSGAKVTGQLNTFHYSVIDQLPGADKQTAMEDFPTMVIALDSGKIDAYVSERPGALAATLTNPGLTYISFEAGKGFTYSEDEASIAVGLRKDSELKAKIDEILKGIPKADRETIMDNAIKNQPVA